MFPARNEAVAAEIPANPPNETREPRGTQEQRDEQRRCLRDSFRPLDGAVSHTLGL